MQIYQSFIKFFIPGKPNSSEGTRGVVGSQSQTTESKAQINTVATKALKFEHIDKGAVKDVWGIKREAIGPSEQDSLSEDLSKNVYYTPVVSLFKSNEKELKREYQTMKDIKSTLLAKNLSQAHLAVEAEEVTPDKRIKGRYTLQVERAGGEFKDINLEHTLRRPEVPLQNKINFGSHFLDGLANLHGTGRAYGDLKPENCLIYGATLKVADFGKTVEVEDNEKPYRGNTRYAPPEGKLSQKGDVYSAALVLIRLFEEECFKKDQRPILEVDPKSKKFDMKASSKLRGIEKFVVEHTAFLACNPGFSLKGLKRRFEMKNRSQDQKKMQEQSEAVKEYIRELRMRLLQDQNSRSAEEKQKIFNFCDLLVDMTKAEPSKRITMKEASERYEAIFNQKKK